MVCFQLPSGLFSKLSSLMHTRGRGAFGSFQNRVREPVIGIDIGTSEIKITELDLSGDRPRLVASGVVATPEEAIKNNLIVREEEVGNAIRALLEAKAVEAKKVAFSLPTPSVFTKRIHVGARNRRELEQNIVFEAANYIPHKIESVHLDYQVLRQSGASGVEVLLVAVKNEIVVSYLNAIRRAGLEPLIADIDCFALENMFALNYPAESSHTAAVVQVGERYSTINILQGGMSLFTGDVGIGEGVFTEAVSQHFQVTREEGRRIRRGEAKQGEGSEVSAVLTQVADRVSAELFRQLGFCWSASGTEQPIEAIFIGGESQVVALLVEHLGVKSGVRCEQVNCFREIECREFELHSRSERGKEDSSLSVSVGLALRRLGDKQHGVEWANDPS